MGMGVSPKFLFPFFFSFFPFFFLGVWVWQRVILIGASQKETPQKKTLEAPQYRNFDVKIIVLPPLWPSYI
jgi:hypothetical protein